MISVVFFIGLFFIFVISIQYGSRRFPGSFSLIILRIAVSVFLRKFYGILSEKAFPRVDMHAFLHKSTRENHRQVVFTQQETIYSHAHLVLTDLLLTSLLVLCFS